MPWFIINDSIPFIAMTLPTYGSTIGNGLKGVGRASGYPATRVSRRSFLPDNLKQGSFNFSFFSGNLSFIGAGVKIDSWGVPE